MENFQNENGPRVEKGWKPLLYELINLNRGVNLVYLNVRIS